MTSQQQKEQPEKDGKGLKQFGRAARRFTVLVIAGAATYGAGVTALYALFNGVTFIRNPEGRAEHVFKDGTHRTAQGRGFSFTNPFTLAETTKWDKAAQTLFFRSGEDERDTFRATVGVTYIGPESNADYAAVRHQAMAAGDKALKEIFQKNRWASYAAVDPATEPQNAAALCKAVTSAVAASLDPKLEQVRLGCDIKVDVLFKGYTAKVS